MPTLRNKILIKSINGIVDDIFLGTITKIINKIKNTIVTNINTINYLHCRKEENNKLTIGSTLLET
jgi:hypothetical protein